MRYYRMREAPQQVVKIPRLDGGINAKDSPQLIGDNQLSDAVNVWWYQGALRTRPGIREDGGSWVEEYNIRQPVSDRETLLAHFYTLDGGASPITYFSAASLSAQDGFCPIGNFGRRCETETPMPTWGHTAVGVKTAPAQAGGSSWLYFLSNGQVLRDNTDALPEEEGWIPADGLFYVPTVRINGVGQSPTEYGTSSQSGGAAYEDFNMLTSMYKAFYTTDGKACNFTAPIWDDSPVAILKAELDVVNTLTGERRHLVFPTWSSSNPWVSVKAEEAGLETVVSPGTKVDVAMMNAGRLCRFIYRGPDGSYRSWMPPAVGDNNLLLTAESSNPSRRQRICRMQQAVWYGGDRSGLEGGTRLFLCGHPDYPNLVHWSDVNRPLYFPAHNYAFVGDASQKITAFGKQGSRLILFKEREIYAADYAAGTQEDLRTAQEGDGFLTAFTARFPLVPLCAGVGCDCPYTVRSVHNRLLWATSSGKVYALTGTDSRSETNVRCLSRNIEPLLAKEGASALRQAGCGEFGDYYVLQVGNTLYLWHTGSPGGDGEEAGLRQVWYVWKLPDSIRCSGLAADDRRMRLTAKLPTGGNTGLTASFEGNTDLGLPIPSAFSTKLYAFGSPDTLKAVNQVVIGAAAENGALRVTYRTENGSFDSSYALEDTGPNRAGVIPKRRLFPFLQLTGLLGLHLESEGPLTVDGLYIQYKEQGGIR